MLADAVLRTDRMTFQDRERLADEVHARQPSLFFSVLALQRYRATFEQIELVLNLLLVFYEAMKISGRAWPIISEGVQERCLKRISGRVRFIQGLTQQQRTQATLDAIADHPEKHLLGYVFGMFREHGLLGSPRSPCTSPSGWHLWQAVFGGYGVWLARHIGGRRSLKSLK